MREFALPVLGRFLPGIVGFDRRYRWIGTVASVTLPLLLSGYLSQVYLARLPAATGNSITALGAVAYGVAVRSRTSRTSLTLPLLAVLGVVAMIPWGYGFDSIGLVAAIGGALCSAATVRAVQRLNVAGILVKGMGISQLVGLGVSLPMLLKIGSHWNGAIVIHGLVAGFLAVLGTVLYNTAIETFELSREMEGFLGAFGPLLSGVVAFFVLHQTPSGLSLAGMLTVFGALVLLALQGSKEEQQKNTEHD
ncbi:hypothetical protein AB0L00_09300 [Actinoallomurus sp. NPDC052308]|uniref:hypothetical protein n=1 Tax=Actinoallomurus sp. NPDC052308 TaxID=3155530 RepID=UPI00342F7926